MPIQAKDWERLKRLRQRFLADSNRSQGIADYWAEEEDLKVYDAVLAARIGWKWDAVLRELNGRAVDLRGQCIVDFGCGTGIATRRFLHSFPADRVVLHDRSMRAMEYAATSVRAAHPTIQVETQRVLRDLQPDVLLISHVLGELKKSGEEALLELIRRSRKVLWVEAGNRSISRRLSALRDELRAEFAILAPCPHQEGCSALTSADEQWCHFFAKAPTEIFMDPDWVKLGKQLNIDLRALPYHFLALSKHSDQAPSSSAIDLGNRFLGRAQLKNKEARFYSCDNQGLHNNKIFKSSDKELYKRLKKNAGDLYFLPKNFAPR